MSGLTLRQIISDMSAVEELGAELQAVINAKAHGRQMTTLDTFLTVVLLADMIEKTAVAEEDRSWYRKLAETIFNGPHAADGVGAASELVEKIE